MKIPNLTTKIVSLTLIAMVGLFSSCKEEDRLTASDTQDVSEEAMTDSYYQDTDDIGGKAIESPDDQEYSGGRKAGTITITDDRFACAGVAISIDATGNIDNPKGVITVDFGVLGCSDSRGNIRKGKIKFAYTGRRFQPGSTVITTFENYTINDIALQGTRTSTNVQGSTSDAPKFNVILTNGKAIFSDGSFAERSSNITWEWIRATNPVDDELVILEESTANGLTRGGRTYSV
ncbi:MAG TPA: hypothetical protein VJ184_13880, partial [Chryseolinea sp.]|nr:hypothetical protein [Chryseolinea sp.]